MCVTKVMEEGTNTGKEEAVDKPKKLLKSGKSPDIGKATQFKPGQSGNPAGKPKGTKHISTWIQELMNDEEFETYLPHPSEGWKQFKGAPMKAIVQAGMTRAMAGDQRWADWLAKYGYGTKVEVSGPEGQPLMGNPYAALTPEQLRALAEAQSNGTPGNTGNPA